MWRGDPLADDFAADAAVLGNGRAMTMLRTACREGIGAVDALRDDPRWDEAARGVAPTGKPHPARA